MLDYLLAWNGPSVLCLLLGLGLLIFEMFTPGMGFPGLCGILSLIAAIVLSADTLTHALISLCLILILLGVLAFFAYRSFRSGRLSRSPIVLKEKLEGQANAPVKAEELLGRTGLCRTALRPSGLGDFDGQPYDVLTRGEFLPKGSPIRVISVEGGRILVEKAKENN